MNSYSLSDPTTQASGVMSETEYLLELRSIIESIPHNFSHIIFDINESQSPPEIRAQTAFALLQQSDVSIQQLRDISLHLALKIVEAKQQSAQASEYLENEIAISKEEISFQTQKLKEYYEIYSNMEEKNLEQQRQNAQLEEQCDHYIQKLSDLYQTMESVSRQRGVQQTTQTTKSEQLLPPNPEVTRCEYCLKKEEIISCIRSDQLQTATENQDLKKEVHDLKEQIAKLRMKSLNATTSHRFSSNNTPKLMTSQSSKPYAVNLISKSIDSAKASSNGNSQAQQFLGLGNHQPFHSNKPNQQYSLLEELNRIKLMNCTSPLSLTSQTYSHLEKTSHLHFDLPQAQSLNQLQKFHHNHNNRLLHLSADQNRFNPDEKYLFHSQETGEANSQQVYRSLFTLVDIPDESADNLALNNSNHANEGNNRSQVSYHSNNPSRSQLTQNIKSMGQRPTLQLDHNLRNDEGSNGSFLPSLYAQHSKEQITHTQPFSVSDQILRTPTQFQDFQDRLVEQNNGTKLPFGSNTQRKLTQKPQPLSEQTMSTQQQMTQIQNNSEIFSSKNKSRIPNEQHEKDVEEEEKLQESSQVSPTYVYQGNDNIETNNSIISLRTVENNQVHIGKGNYDSFSLEHSTFYHEPKHSEPPNNKSLMQQASYIIKTLWNMYLLMFLFPLSVLYRR